MKRTSYSISEETKKEILDLKKQGMKPTAISRVTLIPLSVVKYYFDPEAHKVRTLKWRGKNKKKDRADHRKYRRTDKQREYHKLYMRAYREKKNK